MTIKIRKGSIIDIIAISSKPDTSYFEQIKDYVESLGFIPRLNNNIVDDEEPFYSNTTEFRANLFKDALLAPDSDIIWAIRGGRGALETLDYLEGHISDFQALPNEVSANKLLIGFSDITTMHSYLINKYDAVTLHGEMLERIVNRLADESSIEKLENLLSAGKDPIVYELTKISPKDISDNIEGRVLGGNLTLVTKSIGTPYHPDYSGNFLLFEDISSAPTQIERDLTKLLMSDTLNGVKAVIFADFITDTPENQQYVEWVENRFVNKLSQLDYINEMDVFVVNGIGHASINNPIFLNLESTIYKEDDRYFITMENPIELIEI